MKSGYVAIPAAKFICGQHAPVDIYVRVEAERYLKVLRYGDPFDRDRLMAFRDRHSTNVFVKSDDFLAYISYCVGLFKRISATVKFEQEKDFGLAARVADTIFAAIKHGGIRHELGSQMQDFVITLMRQAQNNESFQLFIADLYSIDGLIARHSTATSVLSLALMHGMGWKTERNLVAVALGGLVHDISLLNRPEVYSLTKDQWSPEVLESYLSHPQTSAAMILSKRLFDDERVTRIVADHHELPDGTGFPNGLARASIFPMALPVIMAERLSRLLFSADSPLSNRAFAPALDYLRNREESYYPSNYWDSLQALSKYIG